MIKFDKLASMWYTLFGAKESIKRTAKIAEKVIAEGNFLVDKGKLLNKNLFFRPNLKNGGGDAPYEE